MARALSKIPVGKIKPLRVSQNQKLTKQKIDKANDRKAANVAQYEKEKAARATSGSRYGYDTMGGNVRSAYTNTNARTFREFIEIAESVSASDVKLAQSGRISRNADALQREIDAVKGGKKPATPNRSARRVTRQDFVDRSNVKVRREETELDEKFALAADKSKPQSPTPTKLPLTRERNIGKHDDWKDKPSTEWNDTPPAAKKLKSRANAVVGTQRRQDKETGVTEETAVADKPATKEEKRKIALMQKLARLQAAAKASKMVSDVAKEEYETEDYKPLERKTGAMIGRATKLGQKGGMAQLAQRRAENTPTGLRTLTGSRAKEEQMKRIKKDAYTKAAKIQVVAATHDPKEVQGKASLNRARGTKSNIRQFSRTTSEK